MPETRTIDEVIEAMAKPHKYHAKRTPCQENYEHPSAAEALRCDEWHVSLQAGEIVELHVHAHGHGKAVLVDLPGKRYFPDFKMKYPDGTVRYEDVKGAMTQVFRWMWRLCIQLGVPLRVVRREGRRWIYLEPPKSWKRKKSK